MQIPTFVLLQFLGLAAALPPPGPPTPPVGPNPFPKSATDSNPYDGRVQYVNPTYAAKLDQTVKTFLAAGDKLNAARTKTVQNTATFVWVTTVAGLSNIDDAIAEARKVQKKTKKPQLVNLVLYDLPSRDCSAGESAGEFQVDNNGLELYKTKFIDPYAKKLRDAKDLTFSVVLEPDSLGNLVTNLGIEQCANVAPTYVEGIAYAIASLQEPNIALYIDAAHGGWLGWADNLPLGKSTQS
jgi:cellulose 1,4-beta-cellobiosidase